MDFNLEYKPHHVICRQGDPSSHLYLLKEGRVLICTVHGTQVKALTRVGPGEFIGELSFFDGQPRSSYILTLEKCIITQIPRNEITDHFPFWFMEAGKNLTKKIRALDEVIRNSNFRKTSAEGQKPLSIEEQRTIYAAITNQLS